MHLYSSVDGMICGMPWGKRCGTMGQCRSASAQQSRSPSHPDTARLSIITFRIVTSPATLVQYPSRGLMTVSVPLPLPPAASISLPFPREPVPLILPVGMLVILGVLPLAIIVPVPLLLLMVLGFGSIVVSVL